MWLEIMLLVLTAFLYIYYVITKQLNFFQGDGRALRKTALPIRQCSVVGARLHAQDPVHGGRRRADGRVPERETNRWVRVWQAQLPGQ